MPLAYGFSKVVEKNGPFISYGSHMVILWKVQMEMGDRAEGKLIQMMTLIQGNGVRGEGGEGIREWERASKPRRWCDVRVNWKRRREIGAKRKSGSVEGGEWKGRKKQKTTVMANWMLKCRCVHSVYMFVHVYACACVCGGQWKTGGEVQCKWEIQWRKQREREGGKEGVHRGAVGRWIQLCRETEGDAQIVKQPTVAPTPGPYNRGNCGFIGTWKKHWDIVINNRGGRPISATHNICNRERQKQGEGNKGSKWKEKRSDLRWKKKSRQPKQVGDREKHDETMCMEKM